MGVKSRLPARTNTRINGPAEGMTLAATIPQPLQSMKQAQKITAIKASQKSPFSNTRIVFSFISDENVRGEVTKLRYACTVRLSAHRQWSADANRENED